MSIGTDTSGYPAGRARWRKGESGLREFAIDAAAADFRASVGKQMQVVVTGASESAGPTTNASDRWFGTIRLKGVTVIDATKPVDCKSLSVPQRQVYWPRTTERPFGGYHPLGSASTPATTRPAE